MSRGGSHVGKVLAFADESGIVKVNLGKNSSFFPSCVVVLERRFLGETLKDSI